MARICMGNLSHSATVNDVRHAFVRYGKVLNVSIVTDIRYGACCDGLQRSGVNRNQGAESTLAHLWAELRTFDVQNSLGDNRKAAVVSA